MRKLTHIEVVNRVKELLPSIEIISEYKGRFKRIIVKDELGILYSVFPDKLFAGKKPSLATAINKTDGFIKKARNIHGDKYDYSKSIYVHDHTKLKITCPLHGDFEQLPTNHLAGQGCYYCGRESMKLNRAQNGFSRTQWINHCNETDKKPKLYIIKCYNDEEQFIKIGITTYNFKDRFAGINMPYNYYVIKELEGTAEDIYLIEKELHKLLKSKRYIPHIKFCGYTECFKFIA